MTVVGSIGLGVALCGAVLLAAPAAADPAGDPCDLGVTFLCHFAPIAPNSSSRPTPNASRRP